MDEWAESWKGLWGQMPHSERMGEPGLEPCPGLESTAVSVTCVASHGLLIPGKRLRKRISAPLSGSTWHSHLEETHWSRLKWPVTYNRQARVRNNQASVWVISSQKHTAEAACLFELLRHGPHSSPPVLQWQADFINDIWLCSTQQPGAVHQLQSRRQTRAISINHQSPEGMESKS